MALSRECTWCQPTQSAMRSFVIVLLSPVVDDPTGFLKRGKEPAVKTPITKHAIETLVGPVLPRTAGRDNVRLDLMGLEPCGDLTGNELRTVVTLETDRSATLCTQPLSHVDNIVSSDGTGTGNGQRLTSICINDRQACEPPSVCRLVLDNVRAPDMVGMDRPRWCHGTVPSGATRVPFLEHLSPLALPHKAHRLAAHAPLLLLQQRVNLPVPKARILL